MDDNAQVQITLPFSSSSSRISVNGSPSSFRTSGWLSTLEAVAFDSALCINNVRDFTLSRTSVGSYVRLVLGQGMALTVYSSIQ